MLKRIRPLIIASAILTAALVSAVSAHARQPQPEGPPPGVRYYEAVGMQSPSSGGGGVAAVQAREIAFHVFGRDFELKLEPNEVYAQGATIVWIDDAGRVEEPADGTGEFYRGRLEGDAGSWVRLQLRPGGELAGVVATADELYFLEPAERFLGAAAAAGGTVAYRLSDTDSTWQPGSCAASDSELHAGKDRRAAKHRLRERLQERRAGRSAAYEMLANAALGGIAGAAGALTRAEIAAVADFQYFSAHGANSAADMAQVVNLVDGVYQAELGVTVQILNSVVYATSNDPFTDTTDPNTILTEFSNYHDSNDNSPGQLLFGSDLAHLFTGRNLNGTVIGIAWLNQLCSSRNGSAVSQVDFSSSLYEKTLLVAHEMGHNFGAPHDNQSGSACASEPGIYIMNPSLGSSLQQKFSPCSKSLINPAVAAAACLDEITPGPTATPTNTFTPTRTPTATPTPTPLPPPVLNPIPAPIVIGGSLTLTGSGFTAGSVMQIFVATSSGTSSYGPYAPSSRTATSLTFNQVDKNISLGNGFGTVLVINTDQNYIASNAQSALLTGNASLNIPTISQINGVALRAFDPTIALATVETVVVQGTTISIGGTGFNNPLVNLFTAAGNKGPLAPLTGGTSTQIQVAIPVDAPTGPGSFQVVNNPYTGNVISNAVSVPIGALVTISGVTQTGSTITINGTGFSTMSVINLFAQKVGGGVENFGGLGSSGPKVPLTFINSTALTFQVPMGAATGPAFVQVLNPPYIPYSSSTNDPDGAFNLTVP